jgi:hypothetical protein
VPTENQTALVSHSAPEEADNPGARGFAWFAQQRALRLVRDCYDGTFALRDGGYLRQFHMERADDHAARVDESVAYNFVADTIQGWTGMVFRKDPVLGEDVPERIREHLENVDLAGRGIEAFSRDTFHDKELDGHTHIFVDWHGPENPATQADEDDARPYAVHIRKEQVTRFRASSGGGNTVLSSFAYIETETVEDGEFTEKEIERVRQYDLVEEAGEPRVRYRAWTRDLEQSVVSRVVRWLRSFGTGEWAPEEDEHGVIDRLLGPRMTRIPLVTDYGNRTGFMLSDPPALDLAHLNLRHFRLSSDHDASLHKTLQAVFVIRGVDPDTIEHVVTDQGLALPETDMVAEYVEPQGNGLQHARDEIQNIEQRAAALGLQKLVRQNRGQRTATEQRTEKDEQDSQLAASAKASAAALAEMLDLWALWMGLDEGGHIEINTDFDTLPMDAQTVTALANMVPEKLSLQTFWKLLVRGEVFPDDFDPEEEAERVANQGVGELMAVVRQIQQQQTPEPDQGGEDEDEGRTA